MKLEPVNDNVIFKFVEDTTSTRFMNSSSAGIIISSKDDNQANVSRWGKVVAIGPKVLDVKVDDYILVESGKWTSGFEHESVRYWKTDENQILAVSDEAGSTY